MPPLPELTGLQRVEAMTKIILSGNLLERALLLQLRHVQDCVEQVPMVRANRGWSQFSGELDHFNERIDRLTNLPVNSRCAVTAVST